METIETREYVYNVIHVQVHKRLPGRYVTAAIGRHTLYRILGNRSVPLLLHLTTVKPFPSIFSPVSARVLLLQCRRRRHGQSSRGRASRHPTDTVGPNCTRRPTMRQELYPTYCVCECVCTSNENQWKFKRI